MVGDGVVLLWHDCTDSVMALVNMSLVMRWGWFTYQACLRDCARVAVGI